MSKFLFTSVFAIKKYTTVHWAYNDLNTLTENGILLRLVSQV